MFHMLYTMKMFIYLLHCPLVKSIRYVGSSCNPYKRASGHWSGATAKKMREWVLALRAKDKRFSCEIVEEVSIADRYAKEEEWVQKLLQLECPLINVIRHRLQ